MPLTLTSKVYKNFPGVFADKVTQHVRQRTELYRTGKKEVQTDDAEVSEMSCREALRPCQTQRPIDPCLTTKRTCTPLSVLSDEEENSQGPRESPLPRAPSRRESPSPRGPSRRESPSPRGPGKRESPSPQTPEYFSNAFKVIRPRQSPRTTVSLDNVDLWEEDDDFNSDGSDFDEINGVAINPCKTFDFSELRRSRSPVACKRNKIDNKKLTVAEELFNSVRKNEDKGALGRVSLASTCSKVSQGMVSPGRVSPGRVSPGRVSPGRVSPGRVSPGRVSPAGRVPPGRRKSPRDLRAWKPRARIAMRHRNMFPNPEPQTSGTDPEHHKAAKNEKINIVSKSIDGHLPMVVKESNGAGVLDGKVVNKRLSLLRSKTDFSLHRLKEEVEMVSDSDNESLTSTGERRVKFNDVVTVREGEANSIDMLRNSNNSAQMYKKQFLVPRGWGDELPDLNGNGRGLTS